MRQARIAGRQDFLAVGDEVIRTDWDELLWSVKRAASGGFIQVDKVSGQVYEVPLVMGSECKQDGDDQSADYCYQCHAVAR